MARGYRRFSATDEDESGHGCELVMRPSPRRVRWGSPLVGCVPTWCGVVGSGRSSGVVPQGG